MGNILDLVRSLVLVLSVLVGLGYVAPMLNSQSHQAMAQSRAGGDARKWPLG